MKSPQRDGTVRQLPSGRWQAQYPSPHETVPYKDSKKITRQRPKRVSAPMTFDSKMDAEVWLSKEPWLAEEKREEQQRIDPALRTYADAWLDGRDLKPSTAALYRKLLDQHMLPTLGPMRLSQITPTVVRTWYTAMDKATPTRRAHTYSLLRTILTSAVEEDILDVNPCKIRGAGGSKRVVKIRPATLPELETIVATVPERYKALILLAAWCALRFGEVTELRRRDVDLKVGQLRIQRGVVRTASGELVIGTPKSEAGSRDVAIPPHLVPILAEHLDRYTENGANALLFPAGDGGNLAPSTLYRVFYRAREAAGRPDLRFHDLRHTGAVLAAATGATWAELMARLGHSTPAAAMRYQHAAADRDRAIAEALSVLASKVSEGT